MSAERWIHVSFYSRLTLQNTVYKDIYSPCQNMAGNPKLFCVRKIKIPLRKHLLIILIGGEARTPAIPILQHLNFLQTLTVRATSSSRFRRMRNLEQKKKIATYNTSRSSPRSTTTEIPSGATFMPEHFSTWHSLRNSEVLQHRFPPSLPVPYLPQAWRSHVQRGLLGYSGSGDHNKSLARTARTHRPHQNMVTTPLIGNSTASLLRSKSTFNCCHL